MFTTPTVFILGAGASWHYGYPTGEGLVNKIIKKAELASTYFEYSMKAQSQELPEYIIKEINQSLSLEEQWKTAFELCNELKRGLETVKPLVIDYYLGWNEHLQSIGRLLIAWVIFECEKNYSELKGNINRRELLESSLFGQDHQRAKDCDVTKYDDDWYRFVLHKLAINCKSSNDLLKKNDVRFITFNYDVSLEIALSQGLKHIKQFTPED